MATPRKESIRGQRKKAVGTAGRGSSVSQASNAVLVKDTRTTGTGKTRATFVVSSDFVPAFDAVALCDHVSDTILGVHYAAVAIGEKADGSGPQPKLASTTDKKGNVRPVGAAAYAARRGDRPNFRGVATGHFRDNITRFPIKVSGAKLTSGVDGTRARCTITAPNDRARFLHDEAVERGIEYFYVEGDVDAAVDLAVRQWTDVALDGEAVGTTEERRAKNSKAL